MTDDRCHHCDMPIATDDDWQTYKEGEGGHLCWEPRHCQNPKVDWRARALKAEALLRAQKRHFER